MSDLFDWRRDRDTEKEAPLAARMRPRTLDDYVGQEAIIGPGRLLRRAIQADQLGSLVFYGPPGTGKTTLARVIANTTKAEFIALNAVLSGVKDIREAVQRAQRLRGERGRRSILFIDEVHRFNKAQQDALLPWVENGTVILVGATTENPYFEVNQALVSRSRIFQLTPLGPEHLRLIAQHALRDPERGYGDREVTLAPEALAHLVDVANGDARALLNALELAVETTPPDESGGIYVDLAVAEESIQQRSVLYDKDGDAHFDAVSAFIKSCRGSDPDAALYWLARMVHAGEDPRFILRRLVILASEDVGLADPDCVGRVMACAQSFDRIGMPEGRYPLAQATLAVALAPKSNSTMGFFAALKDVKEARTGDVPNHLKDGNRDKEGFGHGEGYQYPHAFQEHWVAQQYLPAGLHGHVYYEPSDQGYEGERAAEVRRRREAQIAEAIVAEEHAQTHTTGPEEPWVDRFARRAQQGVGQGLAELRDRVVAAADVQRHHVVLELRARSGLLSFEALPLAPEGGVYTWIAEPDPAEAARYRAFLEGRLGGLPELRRPTLLQGPLGELDHALAGVEPGLRIDRALGIRVLDGTLAALPGLLAGLAPRLPEGGRLVLVEPVPRHAQRLSRLAPLDGLDARLAERWQAAEAHLYADPDDARTAWDGPELVAAAAQVGLDSEVEPFEQVRPVTVARSLFERWWDGAGGRPGYAHRLTGAGLGADDLKAVRQWSRGAWLDRDLPWRTGFVCWVARR